MKSVTWPIHWRYTGDMDKGKQYHGEGRAVLGALKNMTYGGANLGQNRLVKKYAGGVEITAEILPGIDKVHIHVPALGGMVELPEDYKPYFWVGVRIKSGGQWQGGTNPYQTDMSVLLHVWDVPPSEGSNEPWSVDDPNEVQIVSSSRHIGAPQQTADIYPLQFSHDPIASDGKQRYVHRIDAHEEFGTIKVDDPEMQWWPPGNYFYLAQYTKNGLMMPIGLDPYDPEYTANNPDEDKIWAESAWLDPYTSSYERTKSAPRRDARGIHEPFDIDDVSFEVIGKLVSGRFIAKASIFAPSECEGWNRPLVCEMEMRIGKPPHDIRVRTEFEVVADPKHGAAYNRNFTPYGWYGPGHATTIAGNGWVMGDGPATPNTMWWSGALIGDMMGGNIEHVGNFDFSGVFKEPYTIHNEFLGGNRYEESVFGTAAPAISDCLLLTCVGYPHPAHPSVWTDPLLPWIREVSQGSQDQFTYVNYWGVYLAGRLATVVCGYEEDGGGVTSARIMVDDPDNPNYNGELHEAIYFGDTYVEIPGGALVPAGTVPLLQLGQQVVIREPWIGAPGFGVQPVADAGDVGVYRAAAANFDSKYDPPPNY